MLALLIWGWFFYKFSTLALQETSLRSNFWYSVAEYLLNYPAQERYQLAKVFSDPKFKNKLRPRVPRVRLRNRTVSHQPSPEPGMTELRADLEQHQADARAVAGGELGEGPGLFVLFAEVGGRLTHASSTAVFAIANTSVLTSSTENTSTG